MPTFLKLLWCFKIIYINTYLKHKELIKPFLPQHRKCHIPSDLTFNSLFFCHVANLFY